MEKARIVGENIRLGKKEYELRFADGHKERVLTDVWDGPRYKGKECEVLRDGKKKISKVIVAGKNILESSQSKSEFIKSEQRADKNTEKMLKKQKFRNSSDEQQKNWDDNKEVATAPYNFIPINDTVIAAEAIPGEDFQMNKYYADTRFTGYIKLNIKTLTPLYIRDSNKPEEEKKNSEFFSPGNKLRIPGSSIRGMVRNLVEIVSFSKMECFEDKRLYYRTLVDSQSNYPKIMFDGNVKDERKGISPRTKAGWLKQENGKYFIYSLYNEKIYRINFSPVPDKKSDQWIVDGCNKPEFDFHEISFIPQKEMVYKHRRKTRNGKISINYLRYALINDYKMGHCEEERYQKGYLILSGRMGYEPSKHCKHMHPVIHCPDFTGKKKQVVQSVVESYRGDINREPQADLFKILEKYDKGVPCFYQEENGEIKSIGHTLLYRLPYVKKVSDHIPAKHKTDGLDLTNAIFGKAGKFVGRVSFEDAVLCEGQDQVLMDTNLPKILSSPKPTSFQLYLEQKSNNKKELCHWDDSPNKENGFIRGYKLYWHQNNKNDYSWVEKGKKTDAHSELITPVKAKKEFSGHIRFENLSKVELGALLFVLDLPGSMAHKLGMGKPLGLGSVKITPELYLSNRIERYSKLFGNNEWYSGEEQIPDMKSYENTFAAHVMEKLGEASGDLWENDRIKDLKIMLDLDNTKKADWIQRIRYMDVGKFQRKVLPQVKDVLR
jgi:CRISPR-associated protein (TIGR03986 family)